MEHHTRVCLQGKVKVVIQVDIIQPENWNNAIFNSWTV